MSAVHSNLDRGPESLSVIELARQIVKISQSLEDVPRADQGQSWNNIFFHTPPLSEKNAAHWLHVAMDGAHVGQIAPLSACLIIFAQWMLRLEGDKRDREQVFIDLYYKKTLGYQNAPNESDLMLASRAEVDLASRGRILTIRDISPVTASRCGTLTLSDHTVNAYVEEKIVSETHGKPDVDVHLKLRFADGPLKETPSYVVLQNILNNMVAVEINAFIDRNARGVAELNMQLTQNKMAANVYIRAMTDAMKMDEYEVSGIDGITKRLESLKVFAIIGGIVADRLKVLSKTEKNKKAAEDALATAKRGFLTEVNVKLNASAQRAMAKLDNEAILAGSDIEKKIENLKNEWATSKSAQRKRIRGIASPFLQLLIKFPISPVSATLKTSGIRSMLASIVVQEIKSQLSEDQNLIYLATLSHGLENGQDKAPDNHPKFGEAVGFALPSKLKIVPLDTPHPHISRDINDHEIEVDGSRVSVDPNEYEVFKRLEEHNDAKVADLKKELLANDEKEHLLNLAARAKQQQEFEAAIKAGKDALAAEISDEKLREKALKENQDHFDSKLKEYESEHNSEIARVQESFRIEHARLDALQSGLVDSEKKLKVASDKEAEDTARLKTVDEEIKRQRDKDMGVFRDFLEKARASPKQPSDNQDSSDKSDPYAVPSWALGALGHAVGPLPAAGFAIDDLIRRHNRNRR